MAENYGYVSVKNLRSIGVDVTHAGESTIGKVDAESVKHQEPSLWVFHSIGDLTPLECFHHPCRSRFVLQCSLDCNLPLRFCEERCLGGGVWKNEEEYDGITGSDSSKDKKQETPASDTGRRISNTPCNDTANDVSNAVTDEPCCLSEGNKRSVT